MFSRRLSDQEISDYLERDNTIGLSAFVSGFVLWESLTDKGKAQAAAGQKVFKKHQALFAGCDSGSAIGGRVHDVLGKWPDVSSAEKAFLSDLVKAHRPFAQQQV
jgi:hypothetical protein